MLKLRKLNAEHNQGMLQSDNMFFRMRFDVPMLLGLMLLAVIGLIVIYSASGGDVHYVYRQLIRLGVALFVMVMMAQVSDETFQRWTVWIYLITLVLLISAFLFGQQDSDSRRWLKIGSITMQPSELIKLAVPMMLSLYIAKTSQPIKFKQIIAVCILALTPILLLALQPDLGAAILIAGAGIFALFLAGTNWRLLSGFAAGLMVMCFFVWAILSPQQQLQLKMFLNPADNQQGVGYQIVQSKIAIGSGGVLGKGWLHGTQSQLQYISESSTTFAVSVLAEEFGFIGILFLISLYLIVTLRGLYLASRARSLYGQLLSGILVLNFFMYPIINVGVAMGMLPAVVMPLPLISYNAGSLVSIMAGFGIITSLTSPQPRALL